MRNINGGLISTDLYHVYHYRYLIRRSVPIGFKSFFRILLNRTGETMDLL